MWRVVEQVLICVRRVLVRVATDIGLWGRRLDFVRSAQLGSGVVLSLHARLSNMSGRADLVKIGHETMVFGHLLIFPHGGRIAIGDHCFIGEGAQIWSAEKVEIGNRVFVAHGVNIHDTDSHSRSALKRHQHYQAILLGGHPKALADVATSPVRIEDDAWIGFGAVILKGVTVGRGAIVAAGTLVTKDVPAYTVVAGNPAKEIGRSDP